MLWVLFAILAVVAQSQLEDCKLKYYTVNTFRTEKSFTFSCYGSGKDCDVYYASPRNGCNGESPTFIGTVTENQTQVLTSEDDFELSGGFCSNNQIGVYYVDDSGHIIAHLPRATEAGMKFHFPLLGFNTEETYSCRFFALSSPAEYNISIDNGNVYTRSIEPFNWTKFTYKTSRESITSITSDNPVIVSCIGQGSGGFATVQPISSEPLLVTTFGNQGKSKLSVAVVISNCTTNEVIEDISKIEVTSEDCQTGSECHDDSLNNTLIHLFKLTSCEFVFLVEPLDGVCISMGLLTDVAVVDVGLPESRFSTRFVTSNQVESVSLFAFSETTCTGLKNELEPASLAWFQKNLFGKVSFANLTITSAISQVECEDPILMIIREPSNQIPFISGYQPEEIWEPWFDSDFRCSDAPNEDSADAPNEVPPYAPNEDSTDDPTEVPPDAPNEDSADAPNEVPPYAPNKDLTEDPTEVPSDAPTFLDDTISASLPSWTIPVVVVLSVFALAVVIALCVVFWKTCSNRDKKTKSEDDEIVYAEEVVGPEDNQLNHEEICKSKDIGIVYAERVVGPEDNQLNNEDIYIQRENEAKQSFRL